MEARHLVVPLAGAAPSQAPPAAAVVKLRPVGLLVTDTLCAAGAAPPIW